MSERNGLTGWGTIPSSLADGINARTMLRLSLAIVFFWFGLMKPFDVSPAEPLVRPLVHKIRGFAVFLPYEVFMSLLGWWETAVGLLFVFRRTVVLAVAFMIPQMLSTMVALVFLPGITFIAAPLVPSAAGMYIIKNWVLLSAGLVVLSSVRGEDGS